MRTFIAVFALFLVSGAVLLSTVAYAQRTVVYDKKQTALEGCVQVCRQSAATYTCSGTCMSRTADGGFPRDFAVSSTARDMATCLSTLQAACVP